MNETSTRALMLLHPRAARHRQLPELIAHLQALYDLEIQESQFAGHTSQLCAERLKNFHGVVFTAGGDGTFYEAVNAWADLGFPPGPRFGPLPLGTGNDFLFSIDRALRQTSTYLNRPLTRQMEADLGRVTYQTPDGPASKYFCVGATAGFSAQVTFRRAQLAEKVPGAFSYLLSIFLSLGSWRNTWCRVEHDDHAFEHPVFFSLNAANVKHYGGGMVSAPKADPFAGRLDGVSMNLTLPEVLKAMPQNFKGNFHLVRNVKEFPITTPLTLTTGRVTPVQADGEPLGLTPMSIECLPGRLPVLLPSLD